MSEPLARPAAAGAAAPSVPPPAEGAFARWLRAVGLHRPELRAWALYDWANSAFALMASATFPIFYSRVAAADVPGNVATSRFAFTTSLGLAIVAVLAPVLGVVADYLGAKKRLLAAFTGLGAGTTAAMWFLPGGAWAPASLLFLVANVGFAGALVFYDSLLPHVARGDEVHRVSAAGFALGYLGSGLLLVLNLAWVLAPTAFGLADAAAGLRLGFVSVAVWWVLFAIPLFRRVREPAPPAGPDEGAARNPVGIAATRLRATLGELRRSRQALLFLLAWLVYGEGIGTIIRMAAIYGAELGLASTHLLGAILLVQFVAFPFTVLFGALAARIGPRRAIDLALVVYLGICAVGYLMSTALHFYLLAFLVGTVQGGCQALSRSLYATMVPAPRSGEFFGLSATAAKAAGIVGPGLFGLVSVLAGSSRVSVLAVSGFFVLGLALLQLVDVEAGQREARDLSAVPL